MHQCSLALLDKLNPLQELNFEVEKIKENLGTVSLVSQKFNYPYIEYIYNKAMRQHSLVMKINYSVVTKKTILYIDLCSENEWNRNDRIKLTLEPLLVTHPHINYFSISSDYLGAHLILNFNETHNTLFLKTLFNIIDKIIYARDWSNKTGDRDTNTRNIINLDSSIYNSYQFDIESTAKIADYIINYSIDNNEYHPLLAYAIKNCSNNEESNANFLLTSISLSKEKINILDKNKALPAINPYMINVETYKTAFYFNLIRSMLLKGYCFELAIYEIKEFWRKIELNISEEYGPKENINYIVKEIKLQFSSLINLLSSYLKYSKDNFSDVVTKVLDALSKLLNIYSKSKAVNYNTALSWYVLIIDGLYAYKFNEAEDYFKKIFDDKYSKPYISMVTIQFFLNMILRINPLVSKTKEYETLDFYAQPKPILYNQDMFKEINDYVDKLADEDIFYLVEEELVNKDNKTCEPLINAKYQIIASLISAFCDGINENISDCYILDAEDRESISNLLPLIKNLHYHIYKLIEQKIVNDSLDKAIEVFCQRTKSFCDILSKEIDNFDNDSKTYFTRLWFRLFELNKLSPKYLKDVNLFSCYSTIVKYSSHPDKCKFYSDNISTRTEINENILNAYCLYKLYSVLKIYLRKEEKNLLDNLQINESFEEEYINLLSVNRSNSHLINAYISLTKSLENFVEPIRLINDHQPKASLILQRLIDITNILIDCNLTAENYKELLDIFTKFEIRSSDDNTFWINVKGSTFISYSEMYPRINQFTNNFKIKLIN